MSINILDTILQIATCAPAEKSVKKRQKVLAPVCNPTLQVIGLQIPCMEKTGVAVDVL